MPDSSTKRRPDRPPEGFATAYLAAHANRPVRLFLPADYQPKYAYPLVMLFHDEGGDEHTAARLAPELSRRNYIAACPRGPLELGSSPTGRPAFAWGNPTAHRDRYLLGAVAHVRRTYHIHSERIYLMGVGEGASVAYRLGLAMAHRVAGVIALNGPMPESKGAQAAAGLRVFIGHGVSNPVVPVVAARKTARLLHRAGADVQFQTYPTTHRVDDDMLRDVNRWIMSAVTDADSLFPANG